MLENGIDMYQIYISNAEGYKMNRICKYSVGYLLLIVLQNKRKLSNNAKLYETNFMNCYLTNMETYL